MSKTNVIDLSRAREEREKAEHAELDELIRLGWIDDPNENKDQPHGTFQMNQLQDGHTRFTLTVPPGIDPIRFFAESYVKIQKDIFQD